MTMSSFSENRSNISRTLSREEERELLPNKPNNSNLTVLSVSILIFVALSAVGISISSIFASNDRKNSRLDAVDMANEVGAWFAKELDSAMLPLFSIAQFATELSTFSDLPQHIGPAFNDGSVPFLPPKPDGTFNWRRNLTGVCDSPELTERYSRIADAVKNNAHMDGILHNLQLSPQGVICLIHPWNNTEDFDSGTFLDSSGVWGLDLLNDPFHEYIARASMLGTTVGIAGPRVLSQCPSCGLYFIARLPIYDVSHTIQVNGQQVPRWGFATALIQWDRLVKRGRVHERFAQRGMGFRLTRTDRIPNGTSYTAVDVVLAESEDFHTSSLWPRQFNIVSTALQTTNNEWIMAVAYRTGATSRFEVLVIVLIVAVAFCIAALVYIVLMQKQRHALMLAQTEAQKAKASMERYMTAYFAHELRNPLSAIDSALVSLRSTTTTSVSAAEGTEELLEGMTLSCSFMANIMNNLLDVRKIEEGQIVLREDTMSLRALLLDLQKMLRPSLHPGVRLLVECMTTTKNDLVVCDSHRLFQIMINVVSNAAKYTLEGSITLAVQWVDRMTASETTKDSTSTKDTETKYDIGKPLVQLECRDTGPGIPVDEQTKLFEPFFTRGGAPGTGLGLAIAKQMVDLMQGTIRFESDPTVCPGTSCYVELPLAVATCATPLVADLPGAEPMLTHPLHILLVDDIAMNRNFLKRRLQTSIAPNCTVHEASTGEEAIRRCQHHTYDIIVMDHYMEGAGGVMLGTDTVIALRRSGMHQTVVIGCSGNQMDEQFRSAGADCIWNKPMPSNNDIIRQLRQFEDRFQRSYVAI